MCCDEHMFSAMVVVGLSRVTSTRSPPHGHKQHALHTCVNSRQNAVRQTTRASSAHNIEVNTKTSPPAPSSNLPTDAALWHDSPTEATGRFALGSRRCLAESERANEREISVGVLGVVVMC